MTTTAVIISVISSVRLSVETGREHIVHKVGVQGRPSLRAGRGPSVSASGTLSDAFAAMTLSS